MEPVTAVRLQKRDLRALSYISDNRFAPADVLRDLFWRGRKDNSHYKRLRKLLKAGLIEPLFGDITQRLCYCLTPKGAGHLKALGIASASLGRRKPRYGSSFEHDRALHFIRMILEPLPGIENYLSEPQVHALLTERHGNQKEKDERYKVPDALFTLKLPGKTIRVAIELEKTAKKLARTRHLIELSATSPDFETTFYIGSEAKILTRLKRIVADVRRTSLRVKERGSHHGFYFILLDDLLRKKEYAEFEGEGSKITLARLLKIPTSVDPNVGPKVGPRGANRESKTKNQETRK